MAKGMVQPTRRELTRRRARRRILVRWVAVLSASIVSAGLGFGAAYAVGAMDDTVPLTRAMVLSEKEVPQCTPEPLPLILMSGSSTMEQWKSSTQDLAPLNTINIGIGATTLHDQLLYLRPVVTKFKPKVIVMFAGANDLAANGNGFADDLLEELHTYLDEMKQELPGTVLYFVSINTAPIRANNNSSIVTVNTEVAKESTPDGVLRYIETQPALLDGRGKPNAALFRDDGLHLNADGYAIFSQIIGDRLKADGYGTSACVFPDGSVSTPAVGAKK